MNIESVGAQRAVPSHYLASESSNTHSSPWASIHRDQRGPTTEDYHTTGSPAANDMESDQTPNKRAQWGETKRQSHAWHRVSVYVNGWGGERCDAFKMPQKWSKEGF